MISTKMLQSASSLSQGSGETGYFKFLGSMITVWVPIFLICWFGELLTEQVWFIIFCVTADYSYNIKRSTNKLTNKLTINHKVFSDNTFYCPQRSTYFGFFVKPSSDTSITIFLVRESKHILYDKR
jgi:hypothetical protein